jgi:hypothetical protein
MDFTRRAAIVCFVFIAAFSAATSGTASVATANTAAFSQNLQLWDSGNAVLGLQQFLNTQGYLLAPSGPGSPGHETATFGTRTLLSLKRFQSDHRVPTTGFFGPLTRAAANAAASSSASSATSTTSGTTTPSATTTSSQPLGTTSPRYIPGVSPLPGYAPGQIIFIGGGSAATPAPTTDVTPPVISSIVATSISTSTETITWTTNEPANSQVGYGTTVSYSSASSSAALITSHSITITGLTASTTYDFQVSSTDSSANLANSGNQAFATAAYNYYVDSVNGNDANSGTSPSSALADFAYFANTAIPSGSSIGIADGSYIRSQLLIGQPSSPRNNITLTSYGTGANPVIDASDIIPPNCWTLVAGTTYSCSVAGPGTTFSTPYGTASLEGPFIGMWECKSAPCTPTGAGGNDTTMANETSLANAEATAGSYYIADMTATTLTIDYNASDGSNPATNGYTVTYSHRAGGFAITGLNAKISGITAKKNASEGGACAAGGEDGSSPILTNVECDQGSKHNITVPSGTVINGGNFYDAYCPSNVCGGSGSLLVAFDQIGQNLPITLNNVNFYNSTSYPGSTITAGISHTGSGTMGGLTIDGGHAKTVGSGALQGFSFAGVASTTYSNYGCYGLTSCVTENSGPETLSGVQCKSEVANNTCFNSTINNFTLNASNVLACAGSVNHAIFYMAHVALTLTNYIGYLETPSVSSSIHIGDAGAGSIALTSNNNIFDSALAAQSNEPYAFTGTGNTFTGDNNQYASALNVHWILNNTTYTTLATWKAAITPQDAAATNPATGVGLSACTPIY